ncbi:MAG: hypothetical protein ACI8RD_010178 [Bacillariaceae sp.]|jgi:hypothetical protein
MGQKDSSAEVRLASSHVLSPVTQFLALQKKDIYQDPDNRGRIVS